MTSTDPLPKIEDDPLFMVVMRKYQRRQGIDRKKTLIVFPSTRTWLQIRLFLWFHNQSWIELPVKDDIYLCVIHNLTTGNRP